MSAQHLAYVAATSRMTASWSIVCVSVAMSCMAASWLCVCLGIARKFALAEKLLMVARYAAAVAF